MRATSSVEPDTIIMRRRARSLQSDDMMLPLTPIWKRILSMSAACKMCGKSHPLKQFLIIMNTLDETKWTHMPTQSWHAK
jgi:hypothetical protein